MNVIKKSAGDGTAIAPQQTRMSRFRQDVERAFDRAWHALDRDPWTAINGLSAWPAIDVEEDDKAITLKVDIPGMDPDNVSVEVDRDQLTIRGSREEERKSEDDGQHLYERYAGSFARSVTLPSYIDTDHIEAKCDKGVLTVQAPKLPGGGPKRVSVQKG